MSDVVTTMLLNRIANNQEDIAFDLQQQIKALREALAAERQRNADLAHENHVLKARNTSLGVEKNIWRKDHGVLKSMNQKLESDIVRLNGEVAEQKRNYGRAAMAAIAHEATALGYAAQVEDFKAHHPDSPLLEEDDVPGHPDLGRRTPLQATFDTVYTERFRSLGFTGEHLARFEEHLASLENFGIRLPNRRAYTDRDPCTASGDDADVGHKPGR